MPLIEVGDLALSSESKSKHEQLFQAIREKIVHNLWVKSGKLPSTRKLAQALSISRNTVTAAYEQLAAEGYIQSKQGSGFYVALELPDHYVSANNVATNEPKRPKHKPESLSKNNDIQPICPNSNSAFTPGVPDLAQFPYTSWHKLLQRHSTRLSLLGSQDTQGDIALREALSDYLASSRSVYCNAHRIIITSGAQQALSIALMATLERSDSILIEQPGYSQMSKIITLLGIDSHPVDVKEGSGIDLAQILSSNAKALYITPSNQYPMGTTISSENRLKLIEWAEKGNRWIIEDDYDSEFQFAHRPYTSLQGLAGQMEKDANIIYVGSFSKVMFNSLRLGYLVVPEKLISQCLTIKDAITGSSPSHVQAALADFIVEGGLLRHIRKMRRLYKEKYQKMIAQITQAFGDDVEVISQAAGLHITLKWTKGINEHDWVERAKQKGIVIRPLSFYEQSSTSSRNWHGVVLGFGNAAIKDIAPNIHTLAELFYQA